ncbi:ABC transporter substrate-binding protein [Clostridium sp. LP20]
MQNVLSKNADVGFCGPEQVIYIYNQGRDDYPVLFAQLTQRDGSFLVGKADDTNFKWESLKGKKVIGGRPGGVPEMALEYVMKNHGITPNKDVEMVTNIDFTATAGAFKAGSADYVSLFEPTASMLEKEGGGKIVASIGKDSGNLAYTCFFSTKSYMEDNPETIEKFTRAIYKGQKWVQSHRSEEVATSIESFFPGTDKDIIVKVIDNYKEIDALASDPSLDKDELNKLMDVIQSYDSSLIPSRPSFDNIVNNSFAEKIIKEN